MAEYPYTVTARFWSKVNVPANKMVHRMCWPWTGSTAKGYGQLWVGKTNVRAHRLAYEIANGPVPVDLMVRHKCDNPLCCNPAHLEVGTHEENMRDKAVRGRAYRGGPKKMVQ
ncbi:HNH endonuclease signature motif containing protein [Pararhodobacter sp. CCB-MM2]|uniref:HNH endonuclease signature motif containing protein n=1 Tax=Pararhodobacter sp. CCB-MM2 TaxID=1786003 RepID=UPI0009F42FB5|nr:HNH endonuclease signature motif containing protein [Pararhodobacter sp. CCB-MM2]